jgi:hypothetical protein
MPNKAGLRVRLTISRETYSDYKKKYPDAIKAAEAVIENAWVRRLAGPNATGSIFYLRMHLAKIIVTPLRNSFGTLAARPKHAATHGCNLRERG